MLNALEDLGEDVQEFKNEQTPNPKASFFKFELPDFTLDLLPQIKAPLKFFSSYTNRETANLDDLIEDKNAFAKQKDVDDIRNLKNNNSD